MKRPKTLAAITPQHWKRLAVTYVRTQEHPMTPREYDQLDQQRDQGRYAQHWGWSADAHHVIEDLGRCGCPKEDRRGFRDLVQMIRAGHVGLVLVSDFDRLAVDWDDVIAFLALCRAADTLLAVDGALADCADPTANVCLRLRGAHTQYKQKERALLAECESLCVAVRSAR